MSEVRIFTGLAAALLIALPTARAQPRDITWTLPAQDAPEIIAASYVLASSTPTLWSPARRWDGYAAVMIGVTLTVSSGGSFRIAECSYLPVITVYQDTSGKFANLKFSTTEGNRMTLYGPGTIIAYTVPVTEKYGLLNVYNIASPSGGADSCTISITLTRLGTPARDHPVLWVQENTASPGVTPVRVECPSLGGLWTLTVQNQGGDPLWCGQNAALVVAGTPSMTLAPTSNLYDGTGGSKTIRNYAGRIWCRAATAAGTTFTWTCE